jgi:hypothetical protein
MQETAYSAWLACPCRKDRGRETGWSCLPLPIFTLAGGPSKLRLGGFFSVSSGSWADTDVISTPRRRFSSISASSSESTNALHPRLDFAHLFQLQIQDSRAALRISGVVLLLVMTHHIGHAFVVTAPRKEKPCVVTDLNFEGGTDLEALDKQEDAVAALLKQEKFKVLDCLADAARSGKTKFPGGMWILHNLYAGLDRPTRQHAFLNLNLLALMAVKAEDAEVADSTFKQIGDNWYENTWRKESYFDRSKKWASELAPSAARLRTFRQEAETNMATAEGVQYKRDFEQRLAEPIRHCVQSAGSDRRKFDLLLQVMKDGNLRDVEMPTQTAVVGCLFQELMKFQQPDAVRFRPPPHAPYWVILEIDPATFDVAAK